ncbi:MAG TPA: nucleoside-diphosphate kinase [Polyangia bacterium]|jgi:nucleoside-diphosphate kinase
MSIERTFGIVKPDAVAKNAVGGVIQMIEGAGLKLLGVKMLKLSPAQAEAFYCVHKARPFFPELVKFMISGPCVVMALEGESAVSRYREVMGSTDSTKAAAGTIRAQFGTNIERNAVHGSDGPDTAKQEISFFFSAAELA